MSSFTAGKETDFADVSVVIPCFRCSLTLSRAIESVLGQTLLPKELILVDDCSDDETLRLIQDWQAKYPKWIQTVALPVNVGAGEARNAGWEVAQGKYIAWLDADDSWHPQKLATQYDYMQSHPEVALTGHGHAVKKQPDVLSVSQHEQFFRVATPRVLLKNPFVTPSVMVRTDMVNRFAQGRRYMEDHLLWMELALSGHRIEKSNAPLALLHKAQVGASGLSNHVWSMSKADLGNYWILYKKGLIGSPSLAFCWTWAVVKFFRRSIVFGLPRLYKRWLMRLKGHG